jgi:hypothetical protein
MQNHPKPDSKLILRPKEDFRDIFQPAGPVHVISPTYSKSVYLFSGISFAPKCKVRISAKEVAIPYMAHYYCQFIESYD